MSIYRKDAGSNGLLFDHQGRLLICESRNRRVTRLERDGRITAATGSSAHGQGHETVFAQIVADRLGVEPDVIDAIERSTKARHRTLT